MLSACTLAVYFGRVIALQGRNKRHLGGTLLQSRSPKGLSAAYQFMHLSLLTAQTSLDELSHPYISIQQEIAPCSVSRCGIETCPYMHTAPTVGVH